MVAGTIPRRAARQPRYVRRADEKRTPKPRRINHGFHSAAKPQPNVAKRLECVELAPAFARGGWPESASKLAALQTLREVRQPSGTARPNSYQKDRGFLPSLWRLVSSFNPWDSS